MDFSNRTAQTQAPAPAAHPPVAAPVGPSAGGKKAKSNRSWGRIGTIFGVGAVIILLIALVVAISAGSPKAESSYIQTNKLQAVFLNTGQVYFGNIKSLNSQYLVLTNIYYLQTSGSSSSTTTTSSNTSVSLVKLGCELHQPYDQMVINRTQVTFWENLQETGQVAKAVATFEKQNPNGQKCSDQSSSASTNSTSNTQNAGTSATGGTSTTNP